MKPVVALSTCWNSHRHDDGYAMLREIADLGFEWVELSHGIRIVLVPGILKAVEEGVVKVASCHNFCPLPMGVNHAAPNVFMPSAEDPRERDQWLRHSKRTVDFAAQVKARKVVLHLGSIEFFWFNPVRKIAKYLAAHPGADLAKDGDFRPVREAVLKKLRERMPRYRANMLAGLAALLPYAAQKGVTLGAENREKFEELPLDDDHGAVLQELAPAGPIGYWHDTGHAHIKESFGLIVHRAHLEKHAAQILGFHLHDVSADGRDHHAIGSGRVDFGMISRFWRPEHTLVIELSPHVSRDDVLASKRRVETLVAERFQ
jgi:sugar phosphate isomerase/epimerase